MARRYFHIRSRTCDASASRRSLQRGFTIVELLIVIVVIGILATLSLVAYNNVTNQAQSATQVSELSQWKKKSELHKIENGIECPANYVFVYGNSVLGTSDFCVMKYEAKIQGNDNGTTTYNASMVAESRPTGTPWVNITQTQAIAEATAAGGHLITEAEWMTIAADVLSVKYNWSGGEVGSGYIYQGHINNNPGGPLAASTDDSDGIFGMTGGFGTTAGTNSSRVLYLSSSDAIWDFSGNIAEWTQQAIGTPTLNLSNIGVPGDSAFTWREWTLGSLSLGNLRTESRPGTLAAIDGLSGSTDWNSSQGVGRIYANYADPYTRAFIRGEYWSNPSDAGVLALRVYAGPTSVSSGFGFRVAR